MPAQLSLESQLGRLFLRKNICLLCTTCTQRKRREEDGGKKDRCWLNKLFRKERKIEKPRVPRVSVSETDAENHCEDWNILKILSVYAGHWTQDLRLRRRALYPYSTTTTLVQQWLRLDVYKILRVSLKFQVKTIQRQSRWPRSTRPRWRPTPSPPRGGFAASPESAQNYLGELVAQR